MESLDDWYFEDDWIFPFVKGNQIYGSRGSRVHRIEIHDAHDELVWPHENVGSMFSPFS